MLAILAALTVASQALNTSSAARAEIDTARVEASRLAGILPPAPFEALPAAVSAILAEPTLADIALFESFKRLQQTHDERLSGMQTMRGLPLRTARVRIEPEAAKRLGALVLSEQFWNPGTKACICEPTAAYFFAGPAETLQAVACHDCATVSIESKEGRFFRHLDHVNVEVLEIALQHFPQDSTLEALLTRWRQSPGRIRGAGTWTPPERSN